MHRVTILISAALAALICVGSFPASGGDTMSPVTIIDFKEEDRRWITVHDGVMGGVPTEP